MAQQLFLTLGLARAGSGSPGKASREVLRSWLAERIGRAAEGAVLDNGSGLSRETRLTAQQLARVLQSAWDSVVMPELVASLPVSGTEYTEVLTAFVARQGTEPLGVLGVALPQVALDGETSDDVLRVIGFGAAGLVLVVGTGVLISNSITRPIIAIADASAQVALGNLDTRVVHQGTDELGVLARTFNQMVDDLRQRTLTDARIPSPAGEGTPGRRRRASRHLGVADHA